MLLSSLYLSLKKKNSQIKLALRTSHSWADHNLTAFPPLITQNSVQKGSPEFPEVQKHGAWEGIHSPALFPCRVEEWRQLPGLGAARMDRRKLGCGRTGSPLLLWQERPRLPSTPHLEVCT